MVLAELKKALVMLVLLLDESVRSKSLSPDTTSPASFYRGVGLFYYFFK